MQRYNRTNFASARVAKGIVAAMTATLADGFAHYIEDRKGQRWLRVNVIPTGCGGYTFEFLAKNGQEVGAQILQALFQWPEDVERGFSGLMGEVYSLTEHPLIIVRRKDSEKLDPVNGADALPAKKQWFKGLMENATALAVGALGGSLYAVARDFLPGVLP